MKNLSIKLLVVVVAITLTTNLSAKRPNSVVNETVNLEVTSIVDFSTNNPLIESNICCPSPLNIQSLSAEERDLNVKVEDQNSNHTATAKIMIKSLDGTSEMGPYNLTEGTVLNVVVDQREWVVVVEESSVGSTITNWY